jgi:hypothetical protein
MRLSRRPALLSGAASFALGAYYMVACSPPSGSAVAGAAGDAERE